VVQLLLEKGSNQEKDEKGLTAVRLAVQNRHEDLELLLVEKEANIRAKNQDGEAPLHVAVSGSNEVISRPQLERALDVEAEK
jgi:ankyrin repeat protein